MLVSKLKMCCVVYKSKTQPNANSTQTQRKYVNFHSVIKPFIHYYVQGVNVIRTTGNMRFTLLPKVHSMMANGCIGA